jgi:hypothetical protein
MQSTFYGRPAGTNLMRKDGEKSVNVNPGPKKPYSRPSFRHERVFETMALACGKVQVTQFQCARNRKLS